ncbi:MAG: tetratricopeptide repeat protein, partial [Planctomycetota bacterium]|nr:tetratricopeptide repeat protein [Planctomycetota bacterium]
MTREDRIAEILGSWQDQRDEGTFVDTEALCAEHPELADELRLRLAALNIVEQAYAESRMFDGDAPRRLGEFEIVRELGRGGMGVVYEAVQTSMKRTVALKVLFPSVTSSRRAIERFQREAHAAGRVQHTNIVPVYNLSRENGTWYYAMELVEGASLSTLLRQLRDLGDEPGDAHRTLLGTLDASTETEASVAEPEAADESAAATSTQFTEAHGSGRYYRDVARLFADVADALQAAHDAGVIHRDVKPSNLILDEKGVLKIVDFGIARISDEASGMTVTGEVLGTPIYMSPEHARARSGEIDHRTDIYSLGASLYETLTLRPPFKGGSFPEVYRQILTTQPVAPRRQSGAIPRDLETIVVKAMAKEPRQRYASAGALAHDLRAFAEGYGIDARPVGPVTRTLRVVKRHPVRAGRVAALMVALTTAAYLGWRGAAEERRRVDLEYAALLSETETVTSTAGAARTDETPLKAFFSLQRDRRDQPVVQALDRAIALDPDRPEAWLRRALLPSRTAEKRLADVADAHRRGTPERTTTLARALILRETGQRAEAQALERDITPRSAPPMMDAYLEARLQEERGEWRVALRTLDNLFQRSSKQRFVRIQARLRRAHVRARLGNRAGAVEDLAAYQEQGGASLAVSVQLSWHWHCLGRHESAEQGFSAVINSVERQNKVGAWQALADACTQAGARAWADQATARAVAQHPKSLPLLLARSWALAGRGRRPEALEVAKKAVELAPDDALALYARGTAHLNRGDRWKAWLDLRRASDARPEDAGIMSAAAGALRELGRYRQALALHDLVIELAPYHSFALRDKALTLERVRRFDDALACLNKAIALDPSNAFLIVNKANLLRIAGRGQEGRAVLDSALKREALGAWALMRAAIDLNNQKRFEDALKTVDRTIHLDPELAYAHYVRAHALYWLKRLDEAKQACGRGLELDPRERTTRKFLVALTKQTDGQEASLALIDGWLEKQQQDPRLWQLRGYRLLQMNRLEEGLAAFEKVAQIEPDNADFHLDRHQMFMHNTMLQESLASARAAARAAPDDPEVLTAVAGGLNSLGQYAEALRLLDRVLEIDPENGGAYAFRAFTFRVQGDLERALDEACTGIELDPYDATTWEHRAHIYMELGRLDEALEDYDRCLALNPDHTYAAECRTYALTRVGRMPEALAAARSSVARHPRNSSALTALGSVLSALGHHAEALKPLQQAAVLSPRSPRVLGSLGYTLMAWGRTGEAVKALERSIKLKPEARSLSLLAACYGALGRRDDELKTLREAVDLTPPHVESHYGLLNALLRQGRREECARWASTMARRFPTSAWPHFMRARALLQLKRTAEADVALEAGAGLVTEADARGYMLWQETLLIMGRHQAALDIFSASERAIQRAGAQQPGNTEFEVGLANARIYHASSLSAVGRQEDAEEAYAAALSTSEALLAKGPRSVQARMLQASCESKYSRCLIDRGKLELARKLMRRAIAHHMTLERDGHPWEGWIVFGASNLLWLAEQDAREHRLEMALTSA